jgi:hypothetical protein
LLDFPQVLVAACHWPPFFSQSAFVLYCERSLDPPLPIEGLADGDVGDDPLGEPEPEVPEPLEPPFGLLLSELPGAPVEPPPVPWAAARAGARPMTTTSSVNKNFFIASSLTVIGHTQETSQVEPQGDRPLVFATMPRDRDAISGPSTCHRWGAGAEP